MYGVPSSLHGVGGGFPSEELQAGGLGQLRGWADWTVLGRLAAAVASSSAQSVRVDLEDLAVARDAQGHGDPLQAVTHVERHPEGVDPCETNITF